MGVTIDPREFIRAKRDGLAHDSETLRAFIADCAAKKIPDYQASAWLMAAFLRGLDENETDALTQAFLRSGRIFDWSKLGVAADKDDCADQVVTMCRTNTMTGQTIVIDAGRTFH